jgi:hypothetical protein
MDYMVFIALPITMTFIVYILIKAYDSWVDRHRVNEEFMKNLIVLGPGSYGWSSHSVAKDPSMKND